MATSRSDKKLVAADLGIAEPSVADRLMLGQVAELLLWRPIEIKEAIQRADAVRRLVENMERRHAVDGPAAAAWRPYAAVGSAATQPAAADPVAAGDSP